jgi:hypothetical protein
MAKKNPPRSTLSGKKSASTRKGSSARTKPAPRRQAVAQAAAGVLVVNMIPQSLSGETNQDSEPMLAVNPKDPNQLVGTAFTPDPMGGALAPVYISTNGGNTWVLNAIVAGGTQTSDITVAYGSTTGYLYSGILRFDNTNLNILRTPDPTSAAAMVALEDRSDEDQPFAQAISVAAGNGAAQDRVFVGNNDLGASPKTATIDVFQNGTAGLPNPPTSVRLETRATGGQNGPQIRPTIHADGTVYGAFYGWRNVTGPDSGPLQVTADVVVVRDDAWGAGAAPFAALVDPSDGAAGRLVAQGVTFAFSVTGTAASGQQRLGGTLSIAVDPQNSKTVYLAWGDEQSSTGFTIHVQASTNGGATWSSPELLTLDHATNAALAVNEEGVVGLLYQQLTGTGSARRWVTHFQRSSDGGSTWQDLMLANTPANTPVKVFDPYIGDYDHVLAVGKNFYGIFAANNTPNKTNFPNGVIYQRNADFTTHTLLDVDNTTTVQPSIDPFFFRING